MKRTVGFNRKRDEKTRLRVVREYLTGNKSAAEIASRYSIKTSTVYVWAHRYGEMEKFVPLPQEPENIGLMAGAKVNPTEENEMLKKRVKELEANLKYAELQNLALSTMIDIAEEQGIQIRKKSGAKQ